MCRSLLVGLLILTAGAAHAGPADPIALVQISTTPQFASAPASDVGFGGSTPLSCAYVYRP